MDGVFHFKRFDVANSRSAQKVGTDAVLLGASVVLSGRERRILDIGTGTGVIALMLAQRTEGLSAELPQILGIDIDSEAALEASASFAASVWKDRLSARECSLAELADSLYHPEGPREQELFDLIVSNPPYFDESLPAPQERRNKARHTDSLSYREVVSFAGDYLSEGGRLAMILPSDVRVPLLRFASSFGFYPDTLLSVRTTPAKAPSRLICQLTRRRVVPPPAARTLTILRDGGYTPEYMDLTKDFYLNF